MSHIIPCYQQSSSSSMIKLLLCIVMISNQYHCTWAQQRSGYNNNNNNISHPMVQRYSTTTSSSNSRGGDYDNHHLYTYKHHQRRLMGMFETNPPTSSPMEVTPSVPTTTGNGGIIPVPQTPQTRRPTAFPTINIIPSTSPTSSINNDNNNDDAIIVPPNVPSSSSTTVPVRVPIPIPAPVPVSLPIPVSVPINVPTNVASPTDMLQPSVNISNFDVSIQVISSTSVIDVQQDDDIELILQSFFADYLNTTMKIPNQTNVVLYTFAMNRQQRLLRTLQDESTPIPSTTTSTTTIITYSYGGYVILQNNTIIPTHAPSYVLQQQEQSLLYTPINTIQDQHDTFIIHFFGNNSEQQQQYPDNTNVTITQISIWNNTMVNNLENSTDNDNNNDNEDDSINSNSSNNSNIAMIASLVAVGSTLIAFTALFGIRRMYKKKDTKSSSPTLLYKDSHQQQSSNKLVVLPTSPSSTDIVPFSPYGKEDDDDIDEKYTDNNTVHRNNERNQRHIQDIVQDLEQMEQFQQQASYITIPSTTPIIVAATKTTTTTAEPNSKIIPATSSRTTSEPYLQLDISGGSSNSSSTGRNFVYTNDTNDTSFSTDLAVLGTSSLIVSDQQRTQTKVVVPPNNIVPVDRMITSTSPNSSSKRTFTLNGVTNDVVQKSDNPLSVQNNDNNQMCDKSSKLHVVLPPNNNSKLSILRRMTSNETTTSSKVTTKMNNNSNSNNKNLYSTPVLSMCNSQDSMEGYSLTSGFYGGQRPTNLNHVHNTKNQSTTTKGLIASGTTVVNKHRDPSPITFQRSSVPLSHFVPTTKQQQQNQPRHLQSDNDEYGSDSESHFTYTQVGMAQAGKISTIGSMLPSISIDSADSNDDVNAVGATTFVDDSSSMLLLNDQIGMIADSPTFHDPRRNVVEHKYPTNGDSETPITTNAKKISARTLGYTSASTIARDHPSPIRPLHLPVSSSPINQSMNSTLSSDIVTLPNFHGSRDSKAGNEGLRTGKVAVTANNKCDAIENQPFDEVMDDTMENDLKGFADELDRIKRDIGMNIRNRSSNNDTTKKEKASSSKNKINPNVRHTRGPSDEFGIGR